MSQGQGAADQGLSLGKRAMLHLTPEQISAEFRYAEFIPFLRSFLSTEVSVPDRSHFTLPGPGKQEGTLLIMPAWSAGRYIGVKTVTVFPQNRNHPSIQGSYLLMDGNTGEVLCTLDGLALTVKRTASVSGLASQLLAPPGASSLLMVGTGNLSLELIRAHAAVRPIRKVWIWGRHFSKAASRASAISEPAVVPVPDIEPTLPKADIISCATLSENPLIDGRLLKEGAYLDLVGSFKPHMREANDACLSGADIYVDTPRAIRESGDLAIPLAHGRIRESDVLADLTTLARGDRPARSTDAHHIFFKSVGFAAPDLAAAVFLYERHLSAK